LASRSHAWISSEYVQDIDRLSESDSINGPEGIAPMALNDLHDTCTSETFQWLGGGVRVTLLRSVKRLPDVPANLRTCGGIACKSSRLEPIQTTGFIRYTDIRINVWLSR
jgi:hypothetical protein